MRSSSLLGLEEKVEKVTGKKPRVRLADESDRLFSTESWREDVDSDDGVCIGEEGGDMTMEGEHSGGEGKLLGKILAFTRSTMLVISFFRLSSLASVSCCRATSGARAEVMRGPDSARAC